MSIVPFLSSIPEVKIHDSYSHHKASPGSSKQTALWMYHWFHIHTSPPKETMGLPRQSRKPRAARTLSSWHPLFFCKLERLFTQQDLSLPFILRTTGQSRRWQPSDNIHMEMKECGGKCRCFVKSWRRLLGSGGAGCCIEMRSGVRLLLCSAWQSPTPEKKSLQIIQQWFNHIPYAHYVKPNYDLIWGWWFHHHCILHSTHVGGELLK